MPRRDNDPYASFNYQLELSGINVAGFSECSGLNAETTPIEYREGNENPLTVRKVQGLIKYGNITLKRGVTQELDLINWFKSVIDGDIDRKQSISIKLLDEKRQDAAHWNLLNAWPCKWTGPDLKADGNEIAIESVELCHEGLVRQK